MNIMKKLIILTAIISVMSSITGCIDNSLPMDSFEEVVITPLEANDSTKAGFIIHIIGNMRPQQYRLDCFVDGLPELALWKHMESNVDIPITLDLAPGEHEIWVRLGMNTGQRPTWMCDVTFTMTGCKDGGDIYIDTDEAEEIEQNEGGSEEAEMKSILII